MPGWSWVMYHETAPEVEGSTFFSVYSWELTNYNQCTWLKFNKTLSEMVMNDGMSQYFWECRIYMTAHRLPRDIKKSRPIELLSISYLGLKLQLAYIPMGSSKLKLICFYSRVYPILAQLDHFNFSPKYEKHNNRTTSTFKICKI